jgi:acetylglutamate kinase
LAGFHLIGGFVKHIFLASSGSVIIVSSRTQAIDTDWPSPTITYFLLQAQIPELWILRSPRAGSPMNDAIRKAEVLIEALSYIRTFRDRLTVIKLGGSAMEDPDILRATLQDVVFMETVGMRPILVHGGGKAIDRAMADAGLKPRKVQGRRFTDDETLAIVVRVLLKEISADIEAQIRKLGGRAVGPQQGSLQYLFGEKMLLPGLDGQPIDLGRVGRVTRVDTDLIRNFCAGGVVPIIPSVALDEAAGWLNINADTAAAAVAAQLRAEKLVLLTDTPGILLDRKDETSLVRSLDATQCKDLMARGVIDEGMIPKVEACLEGLQAGLSKTHIIDGRLRHSLLLEIYTDRGVGTEIVRN